MKLAGERERGMAELEGMSKVFERDAGCRCGGVWDELTFEIVRLRTCDDEGCGCDELCAPFGADSPIELDETDA